MNYLLFKILSNVKIVMLCNFLVNSTPTQVFFFNQTYVVETLQHFGILEFSEEEIQVYQFSIITIVSHTCARLIKKLDICFSYSFEI